MLNYFVPETDRMRFALRLGKNYILKRKMSSKLLLFIFFFRNTIANVVLPNRNYFDFNGETLEELKQLYSAPKRKVKEIEKPVSEDELKKQDFKNNVMNFFTCRVS